MKLHTLLLTIPMLLLPMLAAETGADARLREAIQKRVYASDAIPAQIDEIRAAIGEGADPNSPVDGKTPMDLADKIGWDWQRAHVRQALTLAGAKATPTQAQQMLMFGVVYGYPQFVKQALACGAKPDNFIEGEGDIYWHCCGYSFLYALLHGFECHYDGEQVPCLELMLKAGANPNIRNKKDGLVPLQCPRNSPEELALLLQYGADANVTDEKGRNVLMRKLEHSQFPYGFEQMIPLFTSAGVQINHRDSQGLTVMDYALRIHHAAIQSNRCHPNDLKRNTTIVEQLRSLGFKTAAELQQ